MGCVRIIVQEEGVRGLFKGMGMRLARVTSEQAVCFSVMEKIATMLPGRTEKAVYDRWSLAKHINNILILIQREPKQQRT